MVQWTKGFGYAAIMLAFVAGIVASWIVAAYASQPVPKGTHNPNAYTAIVRCDGLAEDSMAHVRLVEYGNGAIVYRCESKGY